MIIRSLFVAAMVAAVSLAPAVAQETVKVLAGNIGREVTWSNTLGFEAEEFAGSVKAGDYIYITFDRTTDVIELKSNGTWLPGSIFKSLGDDTPDYKCYITADGLKALQTYGLEICGASFTVNSVSICNDGFVMPDGAVWGGYFWVDNWNTMELFKTAFDNYDGQRYMDIYLSADNSDFTGYFMKVLTRWDPETVIAGNDAIAHWAGKSVVDLKGVDLKAALADVNALMIQSNPEGGMPYNITAVVLRGDSGGSTAVDEIIASDNNRTDVYNLQGVKVRTAECHEAAVDGLPAGIYIVNGQKVYIR